MVTEERPAPAFAYQKQDVCAQEQQLYLKGTGEGIDGSSVQVIAGLIQQQQVAWNQGKSCQCHSGLLAPTQITCETGKTRKLVTLANWACTNTCNRGWELGFVVGYPVAIVLSYIGIYKLNMRSSHFYCVGGIDLGQAAVMTER